MTETSAVSTASQTAADYLAPGHFVDSDHTAVRRFALEHTDGSDDPVEKAVRLYYAVRDEVVYDPYYVGPNARYFRASDCLMAKRGFCIPKAALLAACARAVRVAARVGYADVRNHLSTPKLDEMVGTNVYLWHSYTELLLRGKWVKATPAFNRELCERFGVHALEFDGRNDSLFQEHDRSGRRHMEYLRERGVFADVPFETIAADFRREFPSWFLHREECVDTVFRPNAD